MWIGMPNPEYANYLCGGNNLSLRCHHLWTIGDVLGSPFQMHLNLDVQKNNMHHLSYMVYLYISLFTFQHNPLQQKEETADCLRTIHLNVISLNLSLYSI